MLRLPYITLRSGASRGRASRAQGQHQGVVHGDGRHLRQRRVRGHRRVRAQRGAPPPPRPLDGREMLAGLAGRETLVGLGALLCWGCPRLCSALCKICSVPSVSSPSLQRVAASRGMPGRGRAARQPCWQAREPLNLAPGFDRHTSQAWLDPPPLQCTRRRGDCGVPGVARPPCGTPH